MIIDGRTVTSGALVNVDLCIVGGGIAGIVLALQYLDSPDVTVALVESGGQEWDARTQELSEAEAHGQAYFPLKETHLRVLGGSSLSYGGICTQLPPIQYRARSWVPDSGWPIDEADLDPYLPRAYDLFEVDVPQAEAGPGQAPGTEWLAVAFSPPTRFGKRYASALDESARVTAYLHSTVTQVVPDPAGKHIEAVEVSTFDGNEYRIEARQFVLAGGGIEVPRLLLASNRVIAAGVGNEHDNVGRYFQEHVRVKDRYRLPKRSEALATRVTGAAGTLRFSRLSVSEAAQEEEELLDYYVNVAFGYACQDTPQWSALRRIVNAKRSPWSDSPYYQDIGGGPNRIRREDIKAALVRPDRTFVSLVGAGLRPPSLRRWLELDSSIEQAPHRENRVVLSSETDELGMPRAELHWRLAGNEERSYRRGLEIVLEELDALAPGLKHNHIDDPDPWPDQVIGTWHHVGTTRMHTDPRRGVVDPELKVHGTDNLYIVGSSVFPTSGATSPSLTIACLALRLRDHLATHG